MEINTFSPETQRYILEQVRLVPQLLAKISMLERTLANSTPFLVHNDSGEEIPAYACMQVTGTEEIGNQNYLVVNKPADDTGEAGWFVFNGPRAIAADEEGVIQKGPVYRGFKNSGTPAAGEIWGPTSGQWYLSTDGSLFRVFGADDVADDVFRVASNVGSGIIDLRLSGNDLQYTFDGSNWTTWHTADTCP